MGKAHSAVWELSGCAPYAQQRPTGLARTQRHKEKPRSRGETGEADTCRHRSPRVAEKDRRSLSSGLNRYGGRALWRDRDTGGVKGGGLASLINWPDWEEAVTDISDDGRCESNSLTS